VHGVHDSVEPDPRMTSYDNKQADTMFRFVETGINDLARKIEQLNEIVPYDKEDIDGSFWRIKNMMHYLGDINGMFHRVRYDYEKSLGDKNPEWDPHD